MEFDPEFVVSMLPKLEWRAFVDAVAQLGIESSLPAEITEEQMVSTCSVCRRAPSSAR